MSNRTAAIAFAAITGCVSIISITSASGNPATPTSGSAANAADECLAAPKATTPAGAHWYYRVEKGTKRKCWYLGDAGGKTKKTTAEAPASSGTTEEGASPPTKITPATKQEASKKSIQKSVANARAELTVGSPDEDPSLAETTWPPMPGPSASADVRNDNQTAAMQPATETANKQGWNVATRWPEPAAASASDQSAAAIPQPAQPAPALTAERLATAATPAPKPAPATTTGAASPQPQQSTAAAETEGMSIRIMPSILVGVLALAAILGPLLFKYFRPKPREDERTYGQRRPIWDLNVSSETLVQDNPLLPASARRFAHNLPEPLVLDDTADEIEQLLARASRRSAA